ncbi:MAG: hypothetical protein IPL13_14420 [Saprospiraceae bacterium]|nr:hypothetical protein [Candidatus Brachybacter algidus]
MNPGIKQSFSDRRYGGLGTAMCQNYIKMVIRYLQIIEMIKKGMEWKKQNHDLGYDFTIVKGGCD